MVMVASKAAVAMVVFSGVMGMVVPLGSMVMLGAVCQPSALLPHGRQLLSWTPPPVLELPDAQPWALAGFTPTRHWRERTV